jgi:hypothetical protein
MTADRSRGGSEPAASMRKPVIIAIGAIASVGKQVIDIVERHPELSVENNIKAAKPRWRDAYDCVGPAGKPNGLTHNHWIGAKAALPQSMTEHDSRQVLFLGCEASTGRHG